MRPTTVALAFTLLIVIPLQGAFPDTELIVPAVGKVEGAGDGRFFTTVCVTNPSTSRIDYTLEFLRSGQSNPQPVRVDESIAAGATRTYENIAETTFGIKGVPGALRVRASADVIVSGRLYRHSEGQTTAPSDGLLYAAVPSRFGIARGEGATLPGVRQTTGSSTNLFLVESGGKDVTLHLRIRSDAGTVMFEGDISLQAWEQRLFSVATLTTAEIRNGVLEASVTSGDGRAILAGSVPADGAQDGDRLEMVFRKESFGAGAAADAPVVRSVNGLTDDVTISGGSNVTVANVPGGIRISASGIPGPKGPQGAPGPKSIVSMQYVSAKDTAHLATAAHDVLSATVDVPVDGQKLWIQSTAEVRFPNHAGVAIYLVVSGPGPAQSSVMSIAVNQISGDYQMNTIETLNTFFVTAPLAAGKWTVTLRAAKMGGSQPSVFATDRAMSAMVVNP